MGPDAFVDVDVGYAISVGQEKSLAWFDVFLDRLDPIPGQSFVARVGECDTPIFFFVTIMKPDVRGAPELQGRVARIPEIVAEIFADHFRFVTETQNEILVAEMGINFHDMPEDGLPADRHHGLRPKFGLFPKSRAFTTAENNNFHRKSMNDRANSVQRVIRHGAIGQITFKNATGWKE
jgi:hypothetical protein